MVLVPEATAVAEEYLAGVQSDLAAFGGVDVGRIEPLRKSKDFAIAAFDAVAVLLARRYHAGELDYETADWIANAIDTDMLELMIQLQPGASTIDTPKLGRRCMMHSMLANLITSVDPKIRWGNSPIQKLKLF